MQFRNRKEAGRLLANELQAFKNQENVVILGLPRGGVPLAYEVAKSLHLPLDVTCPHKIGAPYNPEFAIGAITETGEGIFDELTISRIGVSETYLKEAVAQEKQRATEKLEMYRKGLPPRNLEDKVVILVDDGLATGSTMKAAIQSARGEGALEVIVAVPVSPQDTFEEMQEIADQVIVLSTPALFYAVGQFYEDFSQTSDEEVISLLQDAWHEDRKEK